MSITVSSASSSPSSSARSSPLSTSSPSNTRRQQYHTSPAAGGYLQRTAISNAYNSGGSRSEDAETASTTSDGYHGERPSSPAHSTHSISSSSSSRYAERGSNFKVVIRVRPPLPRELHGDRPFQNVINVDQHGHVLTVSENLSALGNSGNADEEIYGLMERGGAMRATGSTKMNELSSRSHAVFIIIAEQSKTTYVDSKGNDVAPEEFMALVNAYQARHGNAPANGKVPNGANGNAAALHPKLEAMVRQSFKVELEERSRNVVDKRRLLELDEQRRRAEEDKMAAIRALEERSREFMLEKEEKKRLEQRISALTSQMMMSNQRRLTPSGLSGADGEKLNVEDPLIRDAIKEHQDRIRQEYECRLADLEKERETIEEEKAQVDRYKQLLLKQRDIMIALTQRLNERDEQITALQDELDAYDRHQKELEEKLDEKTAHLIHLQRVAMEHNASSPGKTDAELLKALGDWGGGATQAKMTPMSANSAVSEPPAELLITHKQFRPHPVDPVIINDNNYSNNNIGNSGNGLLSAEEKIQELRALVDAQTAEHQRMAKELEDIKSEKVSVEFQMREKLVQVELEARSKDHNRFDSRDKQQLANLQRQLEKLMLENQQLQTRAASDDQTQLQARCETLVKERRAVQTIMEHKIKALVTAIGEASDATLQTAGGAEKLGEPAKWLAREINALQRLVNASIVALRNADAGNSGKPTKESSSSQPTPTTVPAGISSNREKLDSSRTMASPVSGVQPANLSVDELIEQRRAQLQQQRERYPSA
ncbi:hypothetical protein PC118_g9384 [Phytophthora cactorum]|uniref:Kinesin motor domain-containing protein n=1 Tax=Phytophthora cactorum TaxID=29920 RepID=A0A8T1G178_9STRA|nr:hypothetical protein PC118_g9384 [Phytophthora cactorum]